VQSAQSRWEIASAAAASLLQGVRRCRRFLAAGKTLDPDEIAAVEIPIRPSYGLHPAIEYLANLTQSPPVY
jgi:hypothetical protein